MEPTLPSALPSCFDHEAANTPYTSNEEHLGDLQKLLSVYLSLVQMATEAAAGEESSAMAGIAMTHDAASDHVDTYPPHPPAFALVIREMIRAARGHVDGRVHATDRSVVPLQFIRLRERFSLSAFQQFCVLCAYGCERDRGFEQIFVSMHQEPKIRFPTLGAAWSLFSLADSADAAAEWDSGFMWMLFEDIKKNTPSLITPLVLRREAFAFLGGGQVVSRQLRPYAALLQNAGEEGAFLRGELLREVESSVLQMAEDGGNILLLHGKRGSGKKRALKETSRCQGISFLWVRLDLLWDSGSDDELLLCLALPAMLDNTRLCLSLGKEEPGDRVIRLLEMLAPFSVNVILLVENMRTNIDPSGWHMRHIHFPMPDYDQSLALWRGFSQRYEISPDIQWDMLVARYTLTPGQMKSALKEAKSMALPGNTIQAEHLEQAVRNCNTSNLGKIADYIPARYTWDDLALDGDSLELMRDACNRVRHRHLVEDVWGFGRKRAYGDGVSLLLFGAPGTGKTMSAQVISNELKMPLYRINLARIISKYIGETTQNLDMIFSEAKDNNVILFFDEADALFSKRTEVNNSNDRHANSESAYLLQKIEEYSGISILASNLVNNFDDAFRRRIMYFINLRLPDPRQRLALWEMAFADHALLEDVSILKHLADELEISGSVIKAAALQAAYLAANDGGKITNGHIAKAARRELQKLGKVIPPLLTAMDATIRRSE